MAPKNEKLNPTHAKKLRLAIFGGGAVTQQFHFPATAHCPWIELVTIVDPGKNVENQMRGLGYTGRFDAKTVEEFLADRKQFESLNIDAALVALPNWLHESATIELLKSGCHVLCEKPLAVTEKACLRIQEAAMASGKKVAVAMVLRHQRHANTLRRGLSENLIGDLKQVLIEYGYPYDWPAESGAAFNPLGGGCLAASGVHYLDLVENLLGPLSPMKYWDDYRGGCEANCKYELKTAAGAPITMDISYEHSRDNCIRFIGDKGTLQLELPDHDSCKIIVGTHNEIEGRLSMADAYFNPSLSGQTAGYAQQLWDFTQALYQGGKKMATVQEAAQTMTVIDWAYSNRNCLSSHQSSKGRPSIDDSPIAITGGTGFVGTHLLDRLTEIGIKNIKVPVRNYRTCVSVARFSVQMPKYDLLNFDSVLQQVQGSKYVFHLAYGSEDDNKVSLLGTKNVVKACIQAGVESVVIFSTTDVFGLPETNDPVDESWPYARKGTPYRFGKAKAERWCLKEATRSKSTRIVVINPSCIYGPRGKGFVLLPVELARKGEFCWIGEGRVNYSYVANVVDAALLAATNKTAHGKRFIISDGNASWKEFLSPYFGKSLPGIPSYTAEEFKSLLKTSSGPSPSTIDLIRTMVRSVMKSEDVQSVAKRMRYVKALWNFAKNNSWFKRTLSAVKKPMDFGPNPSESIRKPPRYLMDLMAPSHTRLSAQKARADLGWTPLIDLSQGQRITAAWLRETNRLEEEKSKEFIRGSMAG